MFFAFLERTTGITGMPFDRTDLSFGGIGTTFHALLHRQVPGPIFQGMPKKFDVHDLLGFFCCCMKVVNEHGWIWAFRAESDATCSGQVGERSPAGVRPENPPFSPAGAAWTPDHRGILAFCSHVAPNKRLGPK